MIRVLLVDDQELVRSGFRIILESEPGIEVVGEAANGLEAIEQTRLLTPDVVCMDVEMPEMDGISASRAILGGIGGGGKGAGCGGGVESAGGSAADGPSSAEQSSAEKRPAILILTTFGHERYLFDALAAGVSGFLLKTSRAEQLIEAIQTLASGSALLGPDVTRAVIERVARGESEVAQNATTQGGSAQSTVTEKPVSQNTAASNTVVENPAPGEPSAAVQDPLAPLGLTERELEVLRHLATGKSNSEIAGELFLGESTVKTHVSNVLQKLGVRDRIQAVVWAHQNGVG